jgi:hypothetical protein
LWPNLVATVCASDSLMYKTLRPHAQNFESFAFCFGVRVIFRAACLNLAIIFFLLLIDSARLTGPLGKRNLVNRKVRYPRPLARLGVPA